MPQHPSSSPAVALPAWSWGLLPALLVCLAAPAFFVLLLPWLGWVLLAAAMASAWMLERRASAPLEVLPGRTRPPSLLRDLSLIAAGLLVVSVIPLKAELDNVAFVRFTLGLGGAVVVPYVISRFVYRDRAIGFPWRGGGRWTTFQWAWLASVLVLGWLILPFYFITSGVYLNWPVVNTPSSSAGCSSGSAPSASGMSCSSSAPSSRCCAGTSPSGRRTCCRPSCSCRSCGTRLPRVGPLLTIPFALLQGFIFLRTRSLAYVVTVHLLFDAVVFLVLVHAHNPGVLDGFFLVPSP